MEEVEKPVWLHEAEMSPGDDDTNPECGLDFCKTKCCGCDTKFL